MEDLIKGNSIKKEIITREIHQWRNPNGTYAEKDNRKCNEATISLSFQLKAKIKDLKEYPDESFKSVVQRLIKEHYMLQILKRKLNIQQKTHNGSMPASRLPSSN